MVEEYDRIMAKGSASSRLRVFLFFTKPEATVSMGSLLDDAKSETWFVDALNNSGMISRVVSDSAAGDSFVNLDGVVNAGLYFLWSIKGKCCSVVTNVYLCVCIGF